MIWPHAEMRVPSTLSRPRLRSMHFRTCTWREGDTSKQLIKAFFYILRSSSAAAAAVAARSNAGDATLPIGTADDVRRNPGGVISGDVSEGKCGCPWKPLPRPLHAWRCGPAAAAPAAAAALAFMMSCTSAAAFASSAAACARATSAAPRLYSVSSSTGPAASSISSNSAIISSSLRFITLVASLSGPGAAASRATR
eukprot:scaffold17683_cov69-Phaeocystis_antarctica.AAC.12